MLGAIFVTLSEKSHEDRSDGVKELSNLTLLIFSVGV